MMANIILAAVHRIVAGEYVESKHFNREERLQQFKVTSGVNGNLGENSTYEYQVTVNGQVIHTQYVNTEFAE